MYGFGPDDEATGEAAPTSQAPKWYREGLEKLSGQIAEIKAENDRLKAEKAKQSVRDTLTAQGYAPQVADLYAGQPEGLNDWLGTYGAGLAKTGDVDAIEAGQGVQGTPTSAVSPEDQAAMARMAAAGQGGTGALAGEDQLAARMRQAQTPEELAALMREQGSKFV